MEDNEALEPEGIRNVRILGDVFQDDAAEADDSKVEVERRE